MARRLPISCAISGSFAHKETIDATHAAFLRYGVTVLQPDPGAQRTGKLYIPSQEDVRQYGSNTEPVWALEEEVGLSVREIEDRFLRAVAQATLLYVVAPGGYYGRSSAFEIGFAHGLDKPIYSSEPLQLRDDDPQGVSRAILSGVRIMNVPDVVADISEQYAIASGELIIP